MEKVKFAICDNESVLEVPATWINSPMEAYQCIKMSMLPSTNYALVVWFADGVEYCLSAIRVKEGKSND